jgi:hypothetical protein
MFKQTGTWRAGLALTFAILIPIFLIGVPAWLAYRTKAELGASFYWVQHTLQVKAEIDQVLINLETAEAEVCLPPNQPRRIPEVVHFGARRHCRTYGADSYSNGRQPIATAQTARS